MTVFGTLVVVVKFSKALSTYFLSCAARRSTKPLSVELGRATMSVEEVDLCRHGVLDGWLDQHDCCVSITFWPLGQANSFQPLCSCIPKYPVRKIKV